MPEQHDYRVVVFGGAFVGKTNLILRFIGEKFRDNYYPTVEDVYREMITSNGQVCTLHIFDMAGSHQFPAMQRLAIERGHAFILVFSLTNRSSLDIAKTIYMEILETKGKCPTMLVGNKSDDSAGRQVSTTLGPDVAKKWGTGYIETSAKEDQNIKELFQQLLEMDKRRQLSLKEPTEEEKKKMEKNLRREEKMQKKRDVKKHTEQKKLHKSRQDSTKQANSLKKGETAGTTEQNKISSNDKKCTLQ